MPLAVVEPKFSVPSYLCAALAQAVPEIVARALYVEENKDAHLTAKDVRIKLRRMKWEQLDKEDQADINANDIEITIVANDLAGRGRNLPDRRKQIEEAVAAVLLENFENHDRPLTVSVWIWLVPASYGQIEVALT